MIQALILDAGGVLVHPIHGNWNIPVKYREYLGDSARDVGSEAWLEACSAEAILLREDIAIPEIETEYAQRLQFLKNVAGRMGWQLAEDAFTALAHDFTYNPERYAWYPDVNRWLENWHQRMKVGILSDAMPSFRRVLDGHISRQWIDAAVISTEIGCAKPDARMYTEICRQLQADPADCLFVDDRPCNLAGAMACGMQAVQMCRDGLTEWAGPAVHDLAELNAYMEERI